MIEIDPRLDRLVQVWREQATAPGVSGPGTADPGDDGIAWKAVALPARLADIETLSLDIVDRLGAAGFSETGRFQVEMLLEESLTNAWKHGCGRREEAIIEVWWRVDPCQGLDIVIADPGPGFPVAEALARPRIPADPFQDSGRGIALLESYADRCAFNLRGNIVRLSKRPI